MSATSNDGYCPDRCDLCGGVETSVLIDRAGRSMTSDGRILAAGLRKLECRACGLVRNGYAVAAEALDEHYDAAYELGRRAGVAEPIFFTPAGAVPRSKVVFDWMAAMTDRAGMKHPRSILEIGCGEGKLLSRFAERWPDARVSGVDLSSDSVRIARDAGLDVTRGSYADVTGRWDLIYSFAVIEHVPSPASFLAHLGGALAPGGVLLVSQPCQDRGSHDIFFADHLHHFYSRHVAAARGRAGLRELGRAVGNDTFQSFSLHAFSAAGGPGPADHGGNDEVPVTATIALWNETFAHVDRWLASQRTRRLAVWGVGESFRLVQAYSTLGDRRIDRGFDDNPARYQDRGFPVDRLEAVNAAELADLSVLFTFRPGASVLDRLAARGLEAFNPFTVEAHR